MIDRYVEEPLNLLGVQVHRQDAIRAGGNDQVGDQLGGDGHARLVLTVLAGVAVERQNSGDAGSAGPAESIHHDEHLHEMVVRGRRSGLNQEDILTADILLDLHEGLAVGERADGAMTEFDADGFADRLGQRLIGCTAKNLHARLKQKTTQRWFTNWGWTVTGEIDGARIFARESWEF